MKHNIQAVKLTTRWLEDTIIGLNFCPFAKTPYQKGLIRLSSTKAITDSERLDFFIDELALLELNLNSDLSTTLIIFEHCLENFYDFNDFSGLCDDYLETSSLTSEFQIVVFHPEFIFRDSNLSDPTNLVGQSPYPTIHILRNCDIEKAQINYPNVDLIPDRNRQKILDLKLKVKTKRRIK